MQAILFYFWQICLFREGPEKMPASATITIGLCVAYVIAEMISTGVSGDWQGVEFHIIMIAVLISLAIQSTTLFLLLTFKSFGHRFQQSLCALLGSSCIILAILLPIDLILLNLDEGLALDFFNSVSLVIFFWSIVIAGFVLHRSMQTSFIQGTVIALVIQVLINFAIRLVI